MMRILLAACSTLSTLAVALTMLLNPGPAQAQSGNPFSAVAIINDRPITNFELDQRMIILKLFRTPGDLREVALEQLIEDRLRAGAVASMGIETSAEAIDEGMEEFAGRANMDKATFLSALAAQGVAEQTFRDFIVAGIGWRAVVRNRFGPRAQITDAEVDRALALTSRRGGAEAVLAEIVLPARNEAEALASERLAQELSDTISSTGAFSAAARRHSLSPTNVNGGRMPRAMPLSDLPPALRSQILTLAPGQVSQPVKGSGVVALFQLIQLRETGVAEADNVTLEYAEYLIPGARTEQAIAEAAKTAARTDTCNDLYGINKGQAPERLTVHTRPLAEVPQDVAMELAKLDEGESSFALTRGPNTVLLMLCGRTPTYEEQPDPGSVRRQLVAQRLAVYGDAYLAELRADAIIRYP